MRNSPFINLLVEQFDYWGYFAFMNLIELVVQNNSGRLEISEEALKRETRTKKLPNLEKLLDFLQANNVVVYTKTKGKLSSNKSVNLYVIIFLNYAKLFETGFEETNRVREQETHILTD